MADVSGAGAAAAARMSWIGATTGRKTGVLLSVVTAALCKQAVNWIANVAVAEPLCLRTFFSSFLYSIYIFLHIFKTVPIFHRTWNKKKDNWRCFKQFIKQLAWLDSSYRATRTQLDTEVFINANLWGTIDLSLILHVLPQLSPVLAAEFSVSSSSRGYKKPSGPVRRQFRNRLKAGSQHPSLTKQL